VSSDRKVAANRRNAKNSTGPRTAHDKSRSKQNALQHGLAGLALKRGTVVPELERLALGIAGPDPDFYRWHFALIAAEAELELRRVRTVRLEAFASTMPTVSPEAGVVQPNSHSIAMQDLIRLDRYERRAFSRRNKALALL
jgi:hypothetical protein